MQQAHGLVGSSVHRHGRAEPPFLIHMVGDAQMGHQSAGPEGVRLFGVKGGE
jgi:hypothetical protein